jgi:hypothetical protein
MDDLKPGDVVQVTDERTGIVGAFMMVEEVKPWGIQGFIHHIDTFENARRLYLRLEHGRFERIGRAALIPADVKL